MSNPAENQPAGRAHVVRRRRAAAGAAAYLGWMLAFLFGGFEASVFLFGWLATGLLVAFVFAYLPGLAYAEEGGEGAAPAHEPPGVERERAPWTPSSLEYIAIVVFLVVAAFLGAKALGV